MIKAQDVYEFLLTIPKGQVVTYGQIAEALGNKNAARAVGNFLHVNPNSDVYPCYKVVNSQGKLAAHFALGIAEQRKRLLDEGIKIERDRVDLKLYQMR